MVDPLSLVPRLVADVDLHPIDDEVLAFADESLTRLTGTAALGLRAADGVRSVRDIAMALHVSPGDLAELLDGLAAEGLVELHEPGDRVRYRKPDHVGACVDGDQVALVDVRDGRQHALSESGAQLWLGLMGAGDLEDTVAELEVAYPEATGLAQDAARFVDDLVTAGLLERLSPPD